VADSRAPTPTGIAGVVRRSLESNDGPQKGHAREDMLMAALVTAITPLHRLNDAVLRLCRWVVGAALLAMVAVTLLQVFFRYALNNALPWPDEAARFLMLWMTGLGAPIAYRRGGFVAIDMLEDALPGKLAEVLGLVLLAIGLVVLVVGIQLGIDHVSSGWLFNSGSLRLPFQLIGGESVRIKLAWMYMSLLVGLILLLVVNIELILRQVATLLGAGPRLPQLKALDLPEAE
jgi:TRAP-type C4-dicarboxylate transport system permease small subunit